jgi:hypothetical protein
VSDSIHKITASGAWKVLTKVCEGIVNSYPTANALNKIASGLFANLRVELNHVYITGIIPFLDRCHDPFYNWCERPDPKIGVVSFRARQVAFTSIMLIREVESLAAEFDNETLATFENFRLLREELLNEEQKLMANRTMKKFFEIAAEKGREHWRRWWDTNLLALAVFDSHEKAQVVARFLLNMDPSTDVAPELPYFDDFLRNEPIQPPNCDTRREPIEKFIATHRKEIEAIAEGEDMWKKETIPLLENFRLLFFNRYAAFPTTNQATERTVKEKSRIAQTGRKSKKCSQVALAANLDLGVKRIQTQDDNNQDELEAEYESDNEFMELIQHRSAKRTNREGDTYPARATKALCEISRCKQQWDLIEGLDQDGEIREILGSLIEDKADAHQSQREHQVLEQFAAQRNIQKELNVIQKHQKYDHTAISLGRVEWKNLRAKADLEYVKDQLRLRISKEYEGDARSDHLKRMADSLAKRTGQWSALKAHLSSIGTNSSKDFEPLASD